MLVLAPGVSFDGAAHEYRYKGSMLSGVTGIIGKRLGKKFDSWVEEHQAEGVHVHRAVSRWINGEDPESAHPGVVWLTETLAGSFAGTPDKLYSEVLVTDFSAYASAVDIVGLYPDKALAICDIKKGKIDREYVSWQLGVYKYLIEKHTGYRVVSCTAVSVKDREYYPVIPRKAEAVEGLLYGASS
jgi:hypothetical protein